jgi:hypothetical protein
VIVAVQEEEFDAVVLAPIPGRLAEDARDTFCFRLDLIEIGALGAEFLPDGHCDLVAVALVRDADGVEFIIPPPAALVLEIEAADLEVQMRARDILAVEPHLAALDEGGGDVCRRAVDQVFFPDAGELDEERERRTEAVEGLELQLIPEQQASGARRGRDTALVQVTDLDLVLAANRERPSRDVDAPRRQRTPLVLALREVLPQPFFFLRARRATRERTEGEGAEQRERFATRDHGRKRYSSPSMGASRSSRKKAESAARPVRPDFA